MVERRCSCDGRVPPSAWRTQDICRRCWRFPWPGPGGRIDKDVWRWLDGPGIALLTGLPVDDGDLAGATRLALAVAGEFGTVQPQDWDGNRNYLVRDEGQVIGMEIGMIASRVASSSKSRERLDLHNDAAPRWVSSKPIDYLLMLAVSPAESGGETILVSARAVWEEILQADPAAARVLQGDFPFNRSSDSLPADKPDHTVGPVFQVDGDWFTVRCNRFRIETAARDLDQPLTAAQLHALDLMDATLAREDLQLRLTLRPGDCLLLDDRTVVHARTAFRDPPAARPGRCLIRVWSRRREPGHDAAEATPVG
ncbi:TauD/TfdA family dioxygenase [Pseudofrankia sp. BMG5.37]|uniref:TauD/TfdA family dioxygenase n=1 Tax=Pseudofrankia sp. BMG5.37 TaxID=3050035 RepID=UPI0028938FF4|nr:TauD/TfdA family dioxygenase [Pseudofrankia sp. BMG5.37]MDT3445142.1 TauD/TfdA family dioxygenase [Pseudofrankia sp. BMG5.37]